MEHFELIRRDYLVEGRSIRWIARMRGVHRRTVRPAIVQAVPPGRQASRREPKGLTEPMRQAVHAWRQADEQAPAKPRHTGRRIYRRLVKEWGYTGAPSTVRVPVGRRRYDPLSAAVKQVLKGRGRAQSDRFVALRSHYLFEAVFCRPGRQGAHEQGGVEGAVGRFRREHRVPVPAVSGFEARNRPLYRSGLEDAARTVGPRPPTVGAQGAPEPVALRARPAEPFESAEVLSARVDAKARGRVRTHHSSVPVRLSGRRVEGRLQARELTVWQGGQVVARHARLQASHGAALPRDHCREVRQHKPGARAPSQPLAQARAQGQWPCEYAPLWQTLQLRLGEAAGTRQRLEVLRLPRP